MVLNYDSQAALLASAGSRFPRSKFLAIATVYLDALTTNSFAGLPLAQNVRATLNGVEIAVGGDRPWSGAVRIGYRNTFVDPRRGAIIFMGTLNTCGPHAADEWWYYCLRLQVHEGLITEIEEMAFDKNLRTGDASTLTLPDRIWEQVVPEDERSTAAELEQMADDYFSLVSKQIDPGSIAIGPDCQRLELGVFTSNSRLTPVSIRTAFAEESYKWNVVNRRIYVTDETRGVVVAIANFTTPPEYPDNNGSVVFEAFKVQDGHLRHIEAMFRANGQLHSGWGKGFGS